MVLDPFADYVVALPQEGEISGTVIYNLEEAETAARIIVKQRGANVYICKLEPVKIIKSM